MRFGVLGPLAVWNSSGDQVPITEAKVRTILANLLVHHDASVSADQLVENLWQGHPPSRPLNTLQTKISQLRRTLGAERLRRTPTGYRIVVEAGELDSGRFRRAIAEADRAEDTGTRERMLIEALNLWRGPAFADFTDATFVRAEAVRLDELRVGAAERLAQVRIEAGEGAGAVIGLRELIDEHPLRERLHGLYMLALSHAGRRGDALRTFQELRSRLHDQLGIDPDPSLGELYTSILRQETEPTKLPRVAERPRSNLSRPPTELIGRESEIAQVREALSKPHHGPLVTLTGPGGVGKTRLATAVARSLGEQEVPDGAWTVELAGVDRAASASDLAERAIATLGLCEGAADSTFDLASWLRQALRGRRILLVLDNCEHVVGQVAELAAGLLESDGVRIMVTTQEALDIPGETVLPLAPLTLPSHALGPEDMLASSSAVRLFVARARAASPGFALTADNASIVATICRRLDGIPLAIELVTARLRALTLRQIAVGLEDRFALPTGPGRGRPSRQQTLRAMIDWSWNLLTLEERTVLRRLSVNGDGCTLQSARAVCADGHEVLDVLTRLVDRSLLVREGERYRLLESVAAYCLDRLAEAEELEEIRRRFIAFHVREAELKDPLLRGAQQGEAIAWFDTETVNLRHALELAVRRKDSDSALRLTNALAWYWRMRNRTTEAQRSFESALRLPSGTSAQRPVSEGWLSVFRGHPRFETELVAEAAPRLLWSAGAVLCRDGSRRAGYALIEEALLRARQSGDSWAEAAALAERAGHRIDEGEVGASRADARLSSEIFRKLGDRWGLLRANASLARAAEVGLDEADLARLLEGDLRSAEQLDLWVEVIETLFRLGRLAEARGDPSDARYFHERARQVASERSYSSGLAAADAWLGRTNRTPSGNPASLPSETFLTSGGPAPLPGPGHGGS